MAMEKQALGELGGGLTRDLRVGCELYEKSRVVLGGTVDEPLCRPIVSKLKQNYLEKYRASQKHSGGRSKSSGGTLTITRTVSVGHKPSGAGSRHDSVKGGLPVERLAQEEGASTGTCDGHCQVPMDTYDGCIGGNFFAQEERRLELNPEMILANLSALNGGQRLAQKRFYDSKFLEAFRKLLVFMNNFKMFLTDLTIELNQRAELIINRAKMIQAYLEGPKLKTALKHLGKIREEFQSAVKNSKRDVEKKIIVFFDHTHQSLTKKAQTLLNQISAMKGELDLSSKTKVKKVNAYSKEVSRSLEYIKKTIGNTPAVQRSIKNFKTKKHRDNLVLQVEKFGTVAIKNFNSSVTAVRAFGRHGLIRLEDFSFKGKKFLENSKGVTVKNLEDLLRADKVGIQNLQNLTGKKEYMKIKNEFRVKIDDNGVWEFLVGVGLHRLKSIQKFLTVDWVGRS